MLRDSSERESSRSWRSSSTTAREEVVEAPCGALAMGVEDEGVHLLAEVRDVGAEREDVLDRPVVQVEADAHESLLTRRDEDVLAFRRALEQELALEDRRERRGSHGEEGVRACDRVGDAGDDHRARRREPSHERRAQGAAAHERQAAAAERRPGGRARSTALGAVPDGHIGSIELSSTFQREASLATPSRTRSRSWMSHATGAAAR